MNPSMTEQKTQLEKLAERIPDRLLGDNGRGMTAMDQSVATQYLLMILGPYSFEIVRELYSSPKKGGDAVLNGVVARITAVVDGREIKVEEYGGVENANNDDGDGERGKKAASDALKRCAMRMGLGLHIWADGGSNKHYFLDKALQKRREAGEAGGGEGDGDRASEADAIRESTPSVAFAEDAVEPTVEQKRDRLLVLIEQKGRDLDRFESRVGAVDEIDEETLDHWIGQLTMAEMKGAAKRGVS
jgi:hypothetical protein